MCGKRYGRGLRNILICLSLLLVLSSGLCWASDPVDELSLILSDYVQITNSLSNRFQSLSQNYGKQSNLIESMDNRLLTLEVNWMKQGELYASQEKSLGEVSKILDDSRTRIDDLESGYKNMERRLGIASTVNKILIGAVVALAGGLALSVL